MQRCVALKALNGVSLLAFIPQADAKVETVFRGVLDIIADKAYLVKIVYGRLELALPYLAYGYVVEILYVFTVRSQQ